jgi:hypothetical protein
MKNPTEAQKRDALLKAGWTSPPHPPYPYPEWRYGGNWMTNNIHVAYSIEQEAARARARRRKK